ANLSLSAEGASFLLALNRQFLADSTIKRGLHVKIIKRVMELTPGPSLGIPADAAQRVMAASSSDNERLVAAVGGGPQWEEWLAQPLNRSSAVELPELTDQRIIELVTKLSVPDGPVDFSSPDLQPAPQSRSRLKRSLLP